MRCRTEDVSTGLDRCRAGASERLEGILIGPPSHEPPGALRTKINLSGMEGSRYHDTNIALRGSLDS